MSLQLVALGMYLWCSLISFLNPYGWPYVVQCVLYASVYMFLVATNYFIYKLTVEFWSGKRQWFVQVMLAWAICLIVYLTLGAVMGWGHVPFGENNNDMIIESYILVLAYFGFVEIRGAILGVITTRGAIRLKQHGGDVQDAHIRASAYFTAFFIFLIAFNVLQLFDSFLVDPTLFYVT
ncbi:MAG TPA: hypothetical protein VKK79_10280 [Candidatus Lokiarchaeia archaeon]|nr:hypothetical protein [Candidatus Lokiarchaeia archaeon]